MGIIDQGRLIALGTQVELTKLVGEQETLRLHLAEDMPLPDGKVDVFAGLEGVLSAAAVDHQVIVNVADAGEALPAVVARAGEIGLRIRSVDIEEPNLEAVFLHLTGRGLRD